MIVYENVAAARPLFTSLFARIRRVASVIEANHTTATKREEAYRLLAEAEDQCVELRMILAQ